MTIKRFKVTMNVEKEITISIDTSKINDKFFEEFSSYMFHIDSLEEVCEHIGHNIMFNGDDFVEGVGELNWIRPNMDLYGVSVSRVEDNLEEFEVEEVK